jgi:Uma2 family endonuclease
MACTEARFPMVTQANHVAGPRQGEWTYHHYTAIPNEQRYEIIDGVLYIAPPTHSALHQRSVIRFSCYFYRFVEITGPGIVVPGPIDVELAPHTVVQPDLLVLLGGLSSDFLSLSHIIGAPDLVVEILEPNTAEHDRGRKYNAYARGGVKEYWIVDPLINSIEIYALETGIYHLLGIFRREDLLPSRVIKNFPVRVNQFFL